jgi:hypothetical protein
MGMFTRALAILATIATIVAGGYAVIAYHFPSDQKAADGRLNETRPTVSGTGLSINPSVQIKQESRGNNSPNIIGSGNVNIGGR